MKITDTAAIEAEASSSCVLSPELLRRGRAGGHSHQREREEDGGRSEFNQSLAMPSSENEVAMTSSQRCKSASKIPQNKQAVALNDNTSTAKEPNTAVKLKNMEEECGNSTADLLQRVNKRQ